MQEETSDFVRGRPVVAQHTSMAHPHSRRAEPAAPVRPARAADDDALFGAKAAAKRRASSASGRTPKARVVRKPDAKKKDENDAPAIRKPIERAELLNFQRMRVGAILLGRQRVIAQHHAPAALYITFSTVPPRQAVCAP